MELRVMSAALYHLGKDGKHRKPLLGSEHPSWVCVLFPARIIPIFLIHRPENNIPYATVEEELIGEFVKYSIRDGKEINFLRRESEAGQKCCTFQHWVYQKTSGCLLVTDMQGEEHSGPSAQGRCGPGCSWGGKGGQERPLGDLKYLCPEKAWLIRDWLKQRSLNDQMER